MRWVLIVCVMLVAACSGQDVEEPCDVVEGEFWCAREFLGPKTYICTPCEGTVMDRGEGNRWCEQPDGRTFSCETPLYCALRMQECR